MHMTSVEPLRELFAHIGFREQRGGDGDAIWELPVTSHVKNASGGIKADLSQLWST